MRYIFVYKSLHDTTIAAKCLSYGTVFRNGFYGSAVCAYRLQDINQLFDSGSFKEQASSSSLWLPVLDSHVPSPRPGQVRATILCLGGVL